MIAMIGTSDRLCWLAETCKILLLLLLLTASLCVNILGETSMEASNPLSGERKVAKCLVI